MYDYDVELYNKKKYWNCNIFLREDRKQKLISFNRDRNMKNLLKNLSKDLTKLKDDKK